MHKNINWCKIDPKTLEAEEKTFNQMLKESRTKMNKI